MIEDNDSAGYSDFTETVYASLIQQAKLNYKFVRFSDVPMAERCIFWRHDIDFSPNRALRLAAIESELTSIATYFIHIQSSFYNIFEPSQTEIVRKITALGHRIGLHFDATYHSIGSETQLEERISDEAKILERYFDCPVDAFSFHNPSVQHLSWRRDQYAGIVNCYSETFANHVGYCSDSNGYWRHRRLIEVVTEAKDRHLQVLTHPEHWQAEPMSPRARIFRCVRGRASSTMQQYDATLRSHGRMNLTDMPLELQVLLQISYQRFDYVDFLWNSDRLHALLGELVAELDNILGGENRAGSAESMTYRADIQTARNLLTMPQSANEGVGTALKNQCQRIATQIIKIVEHD